MAPLTLLLASITVAAIEAAGRDLVFHVCPKTDALKRPVDSRHSVTVGAASTTIRTEHDTVIEAVAAVKMARSSGYEGNVTVMLCKGVHTHTTPLIITAEHTSASGVTAFVGRSSTLDAGVSA